MSSSSVEFVKTVFDVNSLVTVPCPPCSSDLTPRDFWLFGHIKTSRAGRGFNDIDELLEAVIELWMRFGALNCILFFTTGSNE
jgi:hypothetical protein